MEFRGRFGTDTFWRVCSNQKQARWWLRSQSFRGLCWDPSVHLPWCLCWVLTYSSYYPNKHVIYTRTMRPCHASVMCCCLGHPLFSSTEMICYFLMSNGHIYNAGGTCFYLSLFAYTKSIVLIRTQHKPSHTLVKVRRMIQPKGLESLIRVLLLLHHRHFIPYSTHLR